jgi:hypothetical protein
MPLIVEFRVESRPTPIVLWLSKTTDSTPLSVTAEATLFLETSNAEVLSTT